MKRAGGRPAHCPPLPGSHRLPNLRTLPVVLHLPLVCAAVIRDCPICFLHTLYYAQRLQQGAVLRVGKDSKNIFRIFIHMIALVLILSGLTVLPVLLKPEQILLLFPKLLIQGLYHMRICLDIIKHLILENMIKQQLSYSYSAYPPAD